MGKTSIDKTKEYLASWNNSSKWADHVEIAENSKHNGIELLFNREPFHELQSKLRAIGFRPSKVKNMWYSENSQSAKTFALDVQSTIAGSPTGPNIVLSPSFESNRINIEKKEFSFILITLKDDQLKNYIVFEPSKPKAEVIAVNFAKEKFGDNFSGLAVKPRTQIREARLLFDEGKIIAPESKSEVNEKVAIPMASSSLETQVSNFPIPSLHFPEEEEIIEQYKEKGFPIAFSAQEAFDKNLPVIDLAFRYAAAMEYFKDHIKIPLQEQIQNIQQELKALGKTKNQTEKRNELKNQIIEREKEIRFAEKLVEDENLIFQEDLLSIILDQGKQKGYDKTISSDMSSFRDYMLTNILDNRAIENYPNDPLQKVVNELMDEYVLPKKVKKPSDPLANEHGIYTRETAGKNYEEIIIPMPKSAQYEAQIDIAKRSDGRLAIGLSGSKKFGDFSGFSYASGLNDTTYATRTEALTAGLKEHKMRLEQLLNSGDSILSNEEKKNRQLTTALKALSDFAKVDDLTLEKTNIATIGGLKPNSSTKEDDNLADLPQQVGKKSNSKPKKQNQHSLNKEIEALIDQKDSKQESFNEEEKNKLRHYSGSGGLIKQGATGKGVLYEYYTPNILIKKMWDLAYHFGYDGSSVLEPSVGTGKFLKYAPKGASVVGYEVNHYAARIAQILYPAAQIHEAAFETIFFAGNVHLKDEYSDTRYSLIIGNPPYGEFSGRYAGMGEKKWTGAFQYEHYFTLRGLDLLKSGGLLIYIVPSSFPNSTGVSMKIAAKSTGLDRYYLGTGIFKTTDIETDIIVLRKN